MGGYIALREKFYGCIAGVHIGSAMAAPVEGWAHEKIESEYGTTEDGVERQKLMITAIMEKGGRITGR